MEKVKLKTIMHMTCSCKGFHRISKGIIKSSTCTVTPDHKWTTSDNNRPGWSLAGVTLFIDTIWATTELEGLGPCCKELVSFKGPQLRQLDYVVIFTDVRIVSTGALQRFSPVALHHSHMAVRFGCSFILRDSQMFASMRSFTASILQGWGNNLLKQHLKVQCDKD